MDEQTVKKLFEVIDATAEYKALLMVRCYVRRDALCRDLVDELSEMQANAFHTMRVAGEELQRMLTLGARA